MKQVAWAVAVLGLLCLGAGAAEGQDQRAAGVELKQNRPNPFNPATTIPFSLNGDVFANGHRPKVSLRIYNVIGQLVAVPILQGAGVPLDNVELDCANPSGCDFSAYWDGNVLNSNREAPSGVYLYQLVVDGQRFTRRMLVLK
ncbi:MAG: hypothetical protein ACREN5_09725 [Gemmatimonadales bacterium]